MCSFEKKVAIICIADGFDKLDKEFVTKAKDCGLIDLDMVSEYFEENKPGNGVRNFRSLGKLKEPIETYETANIAHCFYRRICPSSILKGHHIEGKWLQ